MNVCVIDLLVVRAKNRTLSSAVEMPQEDTRC